MEQKTKKIDIKVIVIVAITIIAVIEGIVIFTSNNKDNKTNEKSLEESCIGTWKIVNDDKYYIQTIILYKGGTGKGLAKGKNEDSTEYYRLHWEIKDDILNIDTDGQGFFVTGYTIENNKMTSVDGKYIYNKVK